MYCANFIYTVYSEFYYEIFYLVKNIHVIAQRDTFTFEIIKDIMNTT